MAGGARRTARQRQGGAPAGVGAGGLQIGDVAVSSPDAPTYIRAAQQPLGTATMREQAKEARHGGDVRAAGHEFTPLVYETYGAEGARGARWHREMVASASVVDEITGDPLIGDAEHWARAALGWTWQRRRSIALQRGNARVILSGARRARDRMGVRVAVGRVSGLDDGSGR